MLGKSHSSHPRLASVLRRVALAVALGAVASMALAGGAAASPVAAVVGLATSAAPPVGILPARALPQPSPPPRSAAAGRSVSAPVVLATPGAGARPVVAVVADAGATALRQVSAAAETTRALPAGAGEAAAQATGHVVASAGGVIQRTASTAVAAGAAATQVATGRPVVPSLPLSAVGNSGRPARNGVPPSTSQAPRPSSPTPPPRGVSGASSGDAGPAAWAPGTAALAAAGSPSSSCALFLLHTGCDMSVARAGRPSLSIPVSRPAASGRVPDRRSSADSPSIPPPHAGADRHARSGTVVPDRPPGEAPGGVPASGVGALGSAFSLFLGLTGLVGLALGRAMRRLRQAGELRLAAPFVLIPTRPG
jgi:hypothetical protein